MGVFVFGLVNTQGSGMTHRIYIDEVGNHDMTPRNLENSDLRYLTLAGVIVDQDHMKNVIQPEINLLKARFFQTDPDEHIVFHRKDIVQKKGPFACLHHEPTRAAFAREQLACFARWDYTVIAVTIDKKAMLEQYGSNHFEPYYYCFMAMLERYMLFMHYRDLTGDVMIEKRNKVVDAELKYHLVNFCKNGTSLAATKVWKRRLTSSELLTRDKRANVAGLQLADLLAHPAHYDVLHENGVVPKQTAEFGAQVTAILRASKYYRDRRPNPKPIINFGIKFLPKIK